MNKNISISDKLTTIRNSVRLTQAEFSKKLGVKQSYYSELERGKRDITAKVLETLGKEFSISANWLLLDIGEMYIDSDITNSDNSSKILEKNKEFLDNYLWGSLGSYDKRLISFYDYYNISNVKKLRENVELELKNIYELNRKLLDIFHLLVPDEERFKLLPDFETYVKKVYDEVHDNIEDIGGLDNAKLREILKILSLEEDKLHWVSVLTITTSYMELHKKWIFFKMKGHFPEKL